MKTIIANCVRMSSCYVQYPPPVAGGEEWEPRKIGGGRVMASRRGTNKKQEF